MKSIPEQYGGDTASPRAIYPSSRHGWYLCLLVGSKALLCVSVFLVYGLLQACSVVSLLCFLKLTAGAVLMYIHKPGLTTGRMSRAQGVGVLQLAVLGACHSVLLFHGVRLCGPFRALLVTQHHDTAVVAALTALFSGTGGPARTRGLALFVTAVVALLFLDHDEGRQHVGYTHSFLDASSWLGLADHKLGVGLLVAVLVAGVGVRTLARHLSQAVGGPKSLHALVTLLEGVVLLPWTLLLLCTQFQDAGDTVFSTGYVLPFLVTVFFMFIFNYYADAVCTQRLDVQQVARAGSVSACVCALLIAVTWGEAMDHSLSWGGVLACFLFILGTVGLTSDIRCGAQGSLVGFSSSGLPLYTLTNTALHQSSRSAARLLASVLRHTLDNPNSRRIFYFLCLNLSFTLVEFAYGLWTNSLGLISDAFHMMFDCSALLLGLVAAVLARRKPTKTFSYGYGRVEELSGFVNGLFLLVVSMLVLWEAVCRLLDPPHINTQRLLAVSTAGLCVNLVGILAFRHNNGSHQHSHGSHGHTHSANMEGVFLHVLADTLGSVGVIVSSLLIEQFGWYVADPICSLFIAALIFTSVLPLLRHTASVLLLSAPAGLRRSIPRVLEQVLAVDGVVGVGEQFYWTHSADVPMVMMHVHADMQASQQGVLQQVTGILKQAGFYQPCVQVHKDQFTMLKPSHSNSLLIVKAI